MKCFAEKRFFKWVEDEVAVSLRNRSGSYGGGSEVLVVEEPIIFRDELIVGESDGRGDRNGIRTGECRNYEGGCPTLNTTDEQPIMAKNTVVRRLTPKECERLQGFPDDWTDIGEWTDSSGKKRQTSDTNRYKALGNSIALPYWKVLARRIAAQYDRDITMGSLFDGIGGFPLAFMHTGATPVWASEIDDYCIAVTKRRIGDVERRRG